MCFLLHISVRYINYFILSHASLYPGIPDEESNQYKNTVKKKEKKKRFVLVFYNTGYVADMMDLLFEKVFVNPTPYTDEL